MELTAGITDILKAKPQRLSLTLAIRTPPSLLCGKAWCCGKVSAKALQFLLRFHDDFKFSHDGRHSHKALMRWPLTGPLY
jgi:hypothetical protein